MKVMKGNLLVQIDQTKTKQQEEPTTKKEEPATKKQEEPTKNNSDEFLTPESPKLNGVVKGNDGKG